MGPNLYSAIYFLFRFGSQELPLVYINAFEHHSWIPVALESGLKYWIIYTALRIPIAIEPVWELSLSHTAGTPESLC